MWLKRRQMRRINRGVARGDYEDVASQPETAQGNLTDLYIAVVQLDGGEEVASAYYPGQGWRPLIAKSETGARELIAQMHESPAFTDPGPPIVVRRYAHLNDMDWIRR